MVYISLRLILIVSSIYAPIFQTVSFLWIFLLKCMCSSFPHSVHSTLTDLFIISIQWRVKIKLKYSIWILVSCVIFQFSDTLLQLHQIQQHISTFGLCWVGFSLATYIYIYIAWNHDGGHKYVALNFKYYVFDDT